MRGEVPQAIRRSMNLWIGCVAGALSQAEYLSKLRAAGFQDAAIEVTRVYSVEDAKEFLAGESEQAQRLAAEVDGKFASGFVRATKSAATQPAATQPAATQPAATQSTPAAAGASGCCGGGRCC